MASLNAFGFQVRKVAGDDVPWSESNVEITKQQQNLPWHLPLKSSPSKNFPLQSKNVQLPSLAQQQQQKQQKQQQQGQSIVLKSKSTSSPKNNTITRYFQIAPAAAAATVTKEEPSEQCDEEDDSPVYCVVKHRIPISELWGNIVEEYQPGYSVDPPNDDNQLTMRVLTSRPARGLRRKTRDDDSDDGDSRRRLGRAKMVKLDLVSAFQQVLTVSPTANTAQVMDFEYDDDECLERPVKNRMSVTEAAALFQYIADELLTY